MVTGVFFSLLQESDRGLVFVITLFDVLNLSSKPLFRLAKNPLYSETSVLAAVAPIDIILAKSLDIVVEKSKSFTKLLCGVALEVLYPNNSIVSDDISWSIITPSLPVLTSRLASLITTI